MLILYPSKGRPGWRVPPHAAQPDISQPLFCFLLSHDRPAGTGRAAAGQSGVEPRQKAGGGRGQASYPPARRSNKAQQIEFKDNIQTNKHTKNKMEVMFVHIMHLTHIMQTCLSLQFIIILNGEGAFYIYWILS